MKSASKEMVVSANVLVLLQLHYHSFAEMCSIEEPNFFWTGPLRDCLRKKLDSWLQAGLIAIGCGIIIKNVAKEGQTGFFPQQLEFVEAGLKTE